MNFDYNKHIILLTVTGSRAYGTFNAQSDTDYKGVVIPPYDYARGFLHVFEQKESLDTYGKDSTAYDIRKFFKLAADSNPNILDVLFAPDDLVVVNTKYGQLIRENRDIFLSRKAKHTFSGYAFAQLKRIKSHKAWWDKERDGLTPQKPDRKDFDLDAQPRLQKNVSNPLITIPKVSMVTDIAGYVESERLFHEAQRKYDDWSGWKANRNPNRFKLEAAYSYDVKHAMHLVRLMTMCEEILTTGEVLVKRPDAEFLISIRNGAWTYDRLVAWPEEKESLLNSLYETCTLRPSPDIVKINNLCVNIVKEAEVNGFPS